MRRSHKRTHLGTTISVDGGPEEERVLLLHQIEEGEPAWVRSIRQLLEHHDASVGEGDRLVAGEWAQTAGEGDARVWEASAGIVEPQELEVHLNEKRAQ